MRLIRVLIVAALAAFSPTAKASFLCQGAAQNFQNPSGSYTYTGNLAGSVWSNVGMISYVGNGMAHFIIKPPSGADIQCQSRWNGIYFLALCPAGGALPQAVYIEGSQSNNGHSAVLTADTYTTLFGKPHTHLGSFSASSSSIATTQMFPGNPIPCVNAGCVFPPSVFNYNWEIGGSWHSGTVTTTASNCSYFEGTFSNPNGYAGWTGKGYFMYDSTGRMNFWVWTVDQSTGQNPCPFGSLDCNPSWMWKDWATFDNPPYSLYQTCYGTAAVPTGDYIDFY